MKTVLVFAGNQEEFRYLMREKQRTCQTYSHLGHGNESVIDDIRYRYISKAVYARSYHGCDTLFYGTVSNRKDYTELLEAATLVRGK